MSLKKQGSKTKKRKKKLSTVVKCLFEVSETCRSCPESCPHNNYNAYSHN